MRVAIGAPGLLNVHIKIPVGAVLNLVTSFFLQERWGCAPSAAQATRMTTLLMLAGVAPFIPGSLHQLMDEECGGGVELGESRQGRLAIIVILEGVLL